MQQIQGLGVHCFFGTSFIRHILIYKRSPSCSRQSTFERALDILTIEDVRDDPVDRVGCVDWLCCWSNSTITLVLAYIKYFCLNKLYKPFVHPSRRNQCLPNWGARPRRMYTRQFRASSAAIERNWLNDYMHSELNTRFVVQIERLAGIEHPGTGSDDPRFDAVRVYSRTAACARARQ